MKRLLKTLLLIVIVFIFSFVTVKAENSNDQNETSNEKVIVSTKDNTFIYNNKKYNYEIEPGYEDNIEITFDYEGCTYYTNVTESLTTTGTIGKCANTDMETVDMIVDKIYNKENIEKTIVENKNNEEKEESFGVILGLSTVAIVIGLLHLLIPEGMWYIEWGWRFKEAEPSNAALIVNRTVGAILVAIGVILIACAIAL